MFKNVSSILVLDGVTLRIKAREGRYLCGNHIIFKTGTSRTYGAKDYLPEFPSIVVNKSWNSG